MNYIRKISVGADYKNAMHYIVGQSVLGGSHKIHEIAMEKDGYSVWVINKEQVVKWKEFKDAPIVIEYNVQAI